MLYRSRPKIFQNGPLYIVIRLKVKETFLAAVMLFRTVDSNKNILITLSFFMHPSQFHNSKFSVITVVPTLETRTTALLLLIIAGN
jgi:hypothetical protein